MTKEQLLEHGHRFMRRQIHKATGKPDFALINGDHIEVEPLPDAAGPLMEHSRGKRAFFQALRDYVAESEADGCLFACEMWFGTGTEEGNKHWEELAKISIAEAMRRGWCTRAEGMCVAAQTSEHVYLLKEAFRRAGGQMIFDGKRQVDYIPQDEFDSTFKMYAKKVSYPGIVLVCGRWSMFEAPAPEGVEIHACDQCTAPILVSPDKAARLEKAEADGIKAFEFCNFCALALLKRLKDAGMSMGVSIDALPKDGPDLTPESRELKDLVDQLPIVDPKWE